MTGLVAEGIVMVMNWRCSGANGEEDCVSSKMKRYGTEANQCHRGIMDNLYPQKSGCLVIYQVWNWLLHVGRFVISSIARVTARIAPGSTDRGLPKPGAGQRQTCN